MTHDDLIESDRFEECPHPRQTSAFVGNQRAEAEMLDALKSGRMPHAWLIGGPQGIGKATLAWRLARFVLAHPEAVSDPVRAAADLSVPQEHRAARQVAAGGHGDVALLRRERNEKTGRLFGDIRVDDVRRAFSLFQRASRAGGYRLCIIDSAEDLNASSANALLKLIEEPPPLSLFLIIAHRPAQVLPTLRSRCRTLMLRPLRSGEIVEALRALGPPWAEMNAEVLAQAAERAGGSVQDALRWLGGERLAFNRDAIALLDRLPELDWRGLHRLADRAGGGPEDFALLTATTLDWVHARLKRMSDSGEVGKRRLAPLTEVWDKIRRSARDAEALNLDKRTIILSIFADLAQATRSP